jgi:hypothetical protein
MSEADRVFPSRDGLGAHTSHGERRVVVSRRRNGVAGAVTSRVVEVIHIRRGGSLPAADQPPSTGGRVRAATWPDGFRARTAPPPPQPNAEPFLTEAAKPVAHLLPSGASPTRQNTAGVTATAAGPTETVAPDSEAKPKARRGRPRRFADPFAADDDRANCLRCGYLVEQAREKRGLLTCSKCG